MRRSLVAFWSPPPVACRSPARSCAPKPCRRSRSQARPAAGNGPARPGPARPGPARHGSAGRGRETGKTDSTMVENTCACRRMTGRVVLPTFGNKSRKTTKSEPSTGDKFWESRETAKFDTPFGVLGRVPSTGCNYDSLEETNWPCAWSCQLLETNRGKRQSPTRLRGISWGSGVPTPARSCAPKPGRVPKPGSRSHAEARPGRVRRSIAAGRVPKSGRPPVTARRGPARLGRRRERCRRMTARVVLPTFGNTSRKTTKSEPSTGDTFWARETAKFDTPFGVLGRVPCTGCNYDSLEETNWPCASSCQLLETNRGKRQSPTRQRGISWGNVNVCLHSFQQNSVPTGG